MRRILAVVILPFTLAVARADETPAPAPAAAAAAPAAAQPKLVGVILASGQALLWDEERGEYVLKKVGDELNGGRVAAIEDSQLVLERAGGAREVLELKAAPQQKARKAKRMPALIVGASSEPEQLGAFAASATAEVPVAAAPAPVAAAPAPVAAAPVAPAPAPAPVAAAPVAPAPAPAPVATVPVAPPPAPAPVATVPVAPPPAPAPVATVPVAPPPAPVLPPAPVAPAAPVVVHGPPPSPDSPVVVIPRDVLDRELADFGTLAQEITLTPSPRGGFRIANLLPGSFVERAGLRSGDIVRRVGGRPLNGIEDASAAYAALRTTDRFTVELERNGRPVHLRYVITATQTAQR